MVIIYNRLHKRENGFKVIKVKKNVAGNNFIYYKCLLNTIKLFKISYKQYCNLVFSYFRFIYKLFNILKGQRTISTALNKACTTVYAQRFGTQFLVKNLIKN